MNFDEYMDFGPGFDPESVLGELVYGQSLSGAELLTRTDSRSDEELEELFDTKVNLQCWVKVKEDWRNRQGFLSGLGVGGGSLLMLWLTTVIHMDYAVAKTVNLLFFLPTALIATLFHKKQG